MTEYGVTETREPWGGREDAQASVAGRKRVHSGWRKGARYAKSTSGITPTLQGPNRVGMTMVAREADLRLTGDFDSSMEEMAGYLHTVTS